MTSKKIGRAHLGGERVQGQHRCSY